jgi:hypothetical protein
VYVFALEHIFQLAGAPFDRSSKVKILLQDGIEMKRNVTRSPQAFTASFQFRALNIAGGRYDADRIAWP